MRGAQEPTMRWSMRHRRAARTLPRQRLPPNRQPTYATKDTLTRCRACCAAGCGQSAPHNTSLARAYSAAPTHQIASAAMPVRRALVDAPPPPHHIHTGRTCAQFGFTATPRVADQRRRCGCCKQALGVVAPAPASASAYSQGTIPPLLPVSMYDGEPGCFRAVRPTGRPRGPRSFSRARVVRRRTSCLGTAERRLRGVL